MHYAALTVDISAIAEITWDYSPATLLVNSFVKDMAIAWSLPLRHGQEHSLYTVAATLLYPRRIPLKQYVTHFEDSHKYFPKRDGVGYDLFSGRSCAYS